jgi:aldose 1-epimerase
MVDQATRGRRGWRNTSGGVLVRRTRAGRGVPVPARGGASGDGRLQVPVAFGWHPYFRVPGVARCDLVVSLPARHHLALDERGLPTGDEEREPAEEAALGTRVFDDGYRLGSERRFALSGRGTRLTVEFNRNYPYAQVFAPKEKRFVAFEPMTAPTNALVMGSHPIVEPGDTFTASFRVSVARI